jgi:4-oxalocrotonate tautomerase
MPYVNIKVTDDGVTPEQKAKLIEGATRLLVDVLGKNPATIIVVIDELKTDNWGIAGEQVTAIRKRNAAKAGKTS